MSVNNGGGRFTHLFRPPNMTDRYRFQTQTHFDRQLPWPLVSTIFFPFFVFLSGYMCIISIRFVLRIHYQLDRYATPKDTRTFSYRPYIIPSPQFYITHSADNDCTTRLFFLYIATITLLLQWTTNCSRRSWRVLYATAVAGTISSCFFFETPCSACRGQRNEPWPDLRSFEHSGIVIAAAIGFQHGQGHWRDLVTRARARQSTPTHSLPTSFCFYYMRAYTNVHTYKLCH